jgi:hypothetical protein
LNIIDHGIFNLKCYKDFAILDFNPRGDRYSKELIDSSFARDVRYLERLKAYSWAPEVKHIITNCRQIYIKWHGNTCEDTLSTNWKSQLETIASDLAKESIFKPSFYPKYFYIDNNDNMRAYGFYSSSDQSEQPIDMIFYEPILNPQRKELVEKIANKGKLDMNVLVKHAFTDYIKWPDDALVDIYNKVYC